MFTLTTPENQEKNEHLKAAARRVSTADDLGYFGVALFKEEQKDRGEKGWGILLNYD